LESDSDGDASISNRSPNIGGGSSTIGTSLGGLESLTNIDNTSMTSNSNKNRELGGKLKEIEKILKEKLSNNWVSVRKAFLDIDTDYDGFITAEDFAKLIGSSAGFDYNILKMLIRMKNSRKAG
jgi:hypothetical protein